MYLPRSPWCMFLHCVKPFSGNLYGYVGVVNEAKINERSSDKRGLRAFKYMLCYLNLKTILILKYLVCSYIYVKLL